MNKYRDLLKEVRDTDEFWAQSIISDFTDEVCRLMEVKEITRAQLAERINTTPAYITKILRGDANFTLVTMTKLARALDTIVRVHLAHPDENVHWADKKATADYEIKINLPARPTQSWIIGSFALEERVAPAPQYSIANVSPYHAANENTKAKLGGRAHG